MPFFYPRHMGSQFGNLTIGLEVPEDAGSQPRLQGRKLILIHCSRRNLHGFSIFFYL